MKIFKLTFVVALLFCAISCQKSAVDSTAAVTTDQAMDIAASALSQNSFGFASVTDNVALNAQSLNSVSNGQQAVNSVGTNTVHQACGTTLADSVTASGTSAAVTYNYFFKYSRLLNCNVNLQPDNLVNNLTFKGSFDGPRITSTDAGTAAFTIAGLTTNATNYVVNGEYIRKGAFTSKIGNKASGNSSVDIKVTNLMLTKPDRTIASGSATFSLTGTSAKGVAFSYTGTLVFNGNNLATLTLNSTVSTVYVINLLTGTFTVK